jgi:protein-S-isoprenylcysteine O-methyltransferase Ste14
MEYFNKFPLISFLIIIIAISCRILYLRSKGIVVTSKKSENFPFQTLLYLFFGIFFLLWILQLINIAFQLQLQLLPSWLSDRVIHLNFISIAGFIIALSSLILLILSLLHFQKSLRFGLDKNNLGKLVTSGVFSISRNPFFLSVNLYFSGLACIFPSLFFISIAFMSVFSIHFFILKEEKFLTQHYGNEYINYTKRVRRYI